MLRIGDLVKITDEFVKDYYNNTGWNCSFSPNETVQISEINDYDVEIKRDVVSLWITYDFASEMREYYLESMSK